MKTALSFLVTILLAATLAFGAPKAGDQAPDFTGTDSNGKTHRLSDYKGKYVVLEWTNSGCPFTVKHYASGSMQKLQKQWTAKGVAWLSVLSSAPGKQGYKTAAEENSYLQEKGASPSAVLLDPDGTIGHLYGAKTTPHMFVIDPKGKVVYAGAIDDKPSTDQEDIAAARNYVSAALTEALAGKPVTVPDTTPYGCSVKYRD